MNINIYKLNQFDKFLITFVILFSLYFIYPLYFYITLLTIYAVI
jgi:hypothetical protein